MAKNTGHQRKDQDPDRVILPTGGGAYAVGAGLLAVARAAQDGLPDGWVTRVIVQVAGLSGLACIGVGVFIGRRGHRRSK